MAYYHWASEPVKLDRRHYPQCGHPKPNGLWFDVNGSWKQWCESIQFRLEKLQYRHSVTILDDSRVLYLKNARDIDRFTRRYGQNISGNIESLQNPEEMDEFTRQYGRDLFKDIVGQFSNYIMWEDVAEKHSGIVIHPFSRSRSRKYLWYYGWNCAGGCIWNLNVIRIGDPSQAATG